ncbi:MAG: tRNA (adenosine(37)-N6)-threonylcarbamoyltransferase complex dimerization subunit type 1 TsaB, partial [Deltaproteobacteria bacterium RIFCSPLOWO2_02_FULL_46_8]
MGSIALVEGPHLVAEMQMNVEATHTERLLPAISVLFERTGWKISDLNGLALTIGPGSFTGLRIGLVTLKG